MSEVILARWYAAIRAGDPSELSEIAAPDVVVRWNGPPDLVPWAGEHHGVDAVLAFFRSVAEHLEVLGVEPVEKLEGDGKALIVLAGHWRVRANGRELRLRAANLFTFQEGKVIAYEVFPDSAAFARALAE